MNAIRFEPWNLMNLSHRDMHRYIAPRPSVAGENDSSAADWLPAVDVVEEQDRFVLRADLPGVNPDEININMEDGVLSLTGERHRESSGESGGLQRVERVSGKFYRRFSLPESANAEDIKARSANGILEVSIPKLPEVKARRITVEAA